MSGNRRADTSGDDHPDRAVRLWVLFVLATAGVALAGAGTVLGLGDALGESNNGPEIAVSGDNITVVTGASDRTTVMDLSGVSEVEITLTDDQFRIDVERNETRPETELTETDRTRALAITHGNETVTRALDAFDNHEMSVHPFGAVAGDETANNTRQPDIELGRDGENRSDVDVYLEDESDGNSVTIRRATTPGGQTVAVTVTGTWMEQRSLVIGSVDATDAPGLHADTHVETYSLAIDLETGEIVDLAGEDCCP